MNLKTYVGDDRIAGSVIDAFDIGREVKLNHRCAALGCAYLDVQREEALEALFVRADVAAGVSFDAREFVGEAKVCGDAAGLGIGGDDVPFVTVVVCGFGEDVADFGEGNLRRDVVFARRWVQEV